MGGKRLLHMNPPIQAKKSYNFLFVSLSRRFHVGVT